MCEASGAPARGARCQGGSLLASDPKWEVRKVVAENMASFPEKVFRVTFLLFTSERNALVAAAFERSVSRRSPVAELSSADADVVQGELTSLDTQVWPGGCGCGA